MEAVLSDQPKSFTSIVNDAERQLNMSRRTVARYLARLVEAGIVNQSGGLYWASGSKP
jgi:DNA-binding IclR family transcriptional regulator